MSILVLGIRFNFSGLLIQSKTLVQMIKAKGVFVMSSLLNIFFLVGPNNSTTNFKFTLEGLTLVKI